jgi:hypothetical protein
VKHDDPSFERCDGALEELEKRGLIRRTGRFVESRYGRGLIPVYEAVPYEEMTPEARVFDAHLMETGDLGGDQ